MTLKDRIIKLIPLPESDRLRYFAVLPSTSEIGHLISGYSNCSGGVLILGVLSKNKKIVVTGLSADFQVESVVQNAIDYLSPKPKVESGFADYNGQKLYVIEVSKSDEQVLYKGTPYIIKNKESEPLNHSFDQRLLEQRTGHSNGSTSKNIFISYNWAEQKSAQKLYDFLVSKSYSVKMDAHDLTYKDSISRFMASIRDCNFAILILSDAYLKSPNCMTEVLHILKDKDSLKKTLPIREKKTNLFTVAERVQYVSYWLSKVAETEAHLKGFDVTLAIEEYRKLKVEKLISQEINEFLSTVSDMITSTIEEQENNGYSDIIGYIQSQSNL